MSVVRGGNDPILSKVAERQIRNWELSRQQRLSVPAPQRKEVEDFIAIARNFGAGAKEVAALLAERLGWPIFDYEILGLMAGDDALRRQIYASMDERDIGWYEETLRSLMQPGFVKNDYFSKLTETVLSIARQGHAIFIGRGAGLILPQGVGFRVGLVAPRDMCVETVAQRTGVSPEQAGAEVDRLEQERAEFARRHFNVDATDPRRNDMTINMQHCTREHAVELILRARELRGKA